MTLHYRVIVERYPFPNGVVGGSIRAMKSSLHLTGKTSEVRRKPRTHLAPRGFLSRVGPTSSNSRQSARCWYLFDRLCPKVSPDTKLEIWKAMSTCKYNHWGYMLYKTLHIFVEMEYVIIYSLVWTAITIDTFSKLGGHCSPLNET
jgi:hypothetical protein